MARTRNQDAYDAARDKLLDVGEQLFRQHSFAETGINDVLKHAGVAKGSFYHYFDNKESFGVAVARRYSDQQVAFAKAVLTNGKQAPLKRLKTFFSNALKQMEQREYAEGCLMCNLTTELADEYPAFQNELNSNWQALSTALANCLGEADLADIGLAHLKPKEAADWLLNAWSGALTRMKATGDKTPLTLFIKSVFTPSSK
ncbi:TetR/AcrR family transcriptional regulator [Aurantivibrio plasticivorans]